MKEAGKRFAKLIDLKSIITIVMVVALVIGWMNDKVTSDQFIPLVTMLLTFYFAKNKSSDDNND